MHTASQALAIERQASAQPSLAERVSRPKTRAILGLMRLNFLSVAAGRTACCCSRRWPCCARRGIACDAWKTAFRSEEHTSELQSLMRISYAVFCLKKKKKNNKKTKPKSENNTIKQQINNIPEKYKT